MMSGLFNSAVSDYLSKLYPFLEDMGKKLINEPEHCVEDSLKGLVCINPGLRLLDGHNVVVREDIEDVKDAGKVTLVSGGGSGHEPTHAGQFTQSFSRLRR